jgi:hypothetical protein
MERSFHPIKYSSTSIAFEKYLPPLYRNQGNEKEAEIMIKALKSG